MDFIASMYCYRMYCCRMKSTPCSYLDLTGSVVHKSKSDIHIKEQQYKMALLYLVSLSIVISTKGIESSNLHPTTTQLFTWVVKESTDVSSDLKSTGKMSGWHFTRAYGVSTYLHNIVLLKAESWKVICQTQSDKLCGFMLWISSLIY